MTIFGKSAVVLSKLVIFHDISSRYALSDHQVSTVIYAHLLRNFPIPLGGLPVNIYGWLAFWDNSVSGVHLETEKIGGIQNDPKNVEKRKKREKNPGTRRS